MKNFLFLVLALFVSFGFIGCDNGVNTVPSDCQTHIDTSDLFNEYATKNTHKVKVISNCEISSYFVNWKNTDLISDTSWGVHKDTISVIDASGKTTTAIVFNYVGHFLDSSFKIDPDGIKGIEIPLEQYAAQTPLVMYAIGNNNDSIMTSNSNLTYHNHILMNNSADDSSMIGHYKYYMSISYGNTMITAYHHNGKAFIF